MASAILRPILAAEDNEADAMLLRASCQNGGIKNPLHIVSDGEDVIAYLSGTGNYSDRDLHPIPAMLLLDLRMSRVGGLEVLRWLQTQPKPPFPIVILTGMEDLTDVAMAYLMGAHSFLLKPVQKLAFAAFVDKFKGIEIK